MSLKMNADVLKVTLAELITLMVVLTRYIVFNRSRKLRVSVRPCCKKVFQVKDPIAGQKLH